MTGDPVAWRAIERGWAVLDAAGNELGKVDQVTGDLNADIFNGITVGDGGTVLTRTRYVPAEQVASICEGEIVLRLGAEEAVDLEPFIEPVSKPLASLVPEPDRDDDERAKVNRRLMLGFPLGWALSPRRRRER